MYIVQYMYVYVRYTEKKSFYQKHTCNHRSVLTGIKGDIKSGFLCDRKEWIFNVSKELYLLVLSIFYLCKNTGRHFLFNEPSYF